MKSIPNKLTLLLIATLTAFSLLGCGSSGVSSDDNLVGGDNTTAPIVSPSYPITAHPDSTVVVHSHVSTPTNGATLTHQWTQVSGPAVTLSTTNTPTTTFVSPTNTTQPVVLQHTVTHSQTTQATVTSHTINHTPTTSNLAVVVSLPITIESAQKASLHASASGGDGNYIYTWIQSSGPSVQLDLTHPSAPTFIAPDVSSSETLVFEVTVKDGTGTQVSTSETITVTPKPQGQTLAVVANVPTDVNEGTTFALSAQVSDGTAPYTYLWENLGVPSGNFADASAQNTTFTTFNIGQPNIPLIIRVTVTDSSGASVMSADHNVVVHDLPLAVTIVDGSGTTITNTATVKAGDPLTLTAQGQGGNGIYTYMWDQFPFSTTFQHGPTLVLSTVFTQVAFDTGNNAAPFKLTVTNTTDGFTESIEQLVYINVIAP